MERRGQQQDVAIACQPVDFDDVKHFCSWIHEANDKNFTETAATHFPSYIRFSCDLRSNLDTRGLILPGDIDNLFYIIRASPQVFTLEVEPFCKFAGNALSRFWKAVAESKTKIRSFNLEEQPISDNDSSCIVESLQHVQKLTLRNCGVSRNLVRALSEKWNKISANIEELNLSFNEKIDDEGFVNLARLPGIQRLILGGCDISSKGCVEFVEEIIKRNHKIEYLDLSCNKKIDDEGFVILARLPGIQRLWLRECDISSKGCAEFVEEIIKRNHKIEELHLGFYKKIADGGFVILARLPGIQRLTLGRCDISSKGCVEFVEEIIKRNHKLELLNLSSNRRIGDDGVRSLFRCFPLIEKLWLIGCGVTEAVKEETRSELRRLNLPEDRVVFR